MQYTRERQVKKLFEDKALNLVSHKQRGLPGRLFIHLDEKCNQDCVFCFAKGENKDALGSMNQAEVKKIIRNFVRYGGRSIVFTGGEPTLRNDLPELISYAEKFKEIRNLSVISNGVRLADKKYLEKLLKADVKKMLYFSVSLHSHQKRVSEALTRAKGSYQKTIKAIENILGKERSALIYQVITAKNYKLLPAFCSFLNKKFPKINNITFAYPFPQGNALENSWVFPRLGLMKPYLLKALTFLEKKNYNTYIAVCGQFPLCVVPKFEEKVLINLISNEKKLLGTVGHKAFYDFAMADEKWQNEYRVKHKKCQSCILNSICQGFWRQYITLFGFNGIKPVTFNNFQGNKLVCSLKEQKGFTSILAKLNKNKLNILKLNNHNNNQLQKLLNEFGKNDILAIILDKNNNFLALNFLKQW